MKKTLFSIAAIAFTMTFTEAVAQDKTESSSGTTIERSVEDKKKEADALQNRIEQYTIKVEANKDNPNMDYESEKARLQEWKAKWETLTGKTWQEEEKK